MVDIGILLGTREICARRANTSYPNNARRGETPARLDQAFFTSLTSFVREVFASPKSMLVAGA
jgi:hypothetical protein